MSLSFGLDFQEGLQELRNTAKNFREDSLNKGLAREFSKQAWHLCDHAYAANSGGFSTLVKFQTHIRTLCPEMEYMQTICTAAKHGNRLHFKPPIKATYLRGGPFSQAFSRAWDISRLVIQLDDGSELWFIDAMDRVERFWMDDPWGR